MGTFTGLADRAEAEGRLRNATSYLRLAEFFTPKRDGADSHCQMGNLDLACAVITAWLRD